MSIEGGLYRALERGHSIGCNTIQIFTKNSNRWLNPPLSNEDANNFLRMRSYLSIHPVFAHCSYLINLAAKGELRTKSIRALVDEVERAEQLGLEFVVLHPGSHTGQGEMPGLRLVADALLTVLRTTSGYRCKIAVENTAGQGSSLGYSIEHLAYLYRKTRSSSRIGFCLDTCHLFAAGYNLAAPNGFKAFIRKLKKEIPLEAVLAYHLNDSKKPLGARVDRHEHIGKGWIGIEAFRSLMQDRRFRSIPKVLETPKGKDLAEDVANLKLLRKIARKDSGTSRR